MTRNHPLSTLILVSLLATGCGEPGKPEEPCGCDLMEGNGCSMRFGEERSYHVKIPETRRRTWKDLSHYLYFHSRVTPGLRVDFEAPLPVNKRISLKKELVCHYTLSGEGLQVSGELEGIRVDEDGGGFWCFDYLGTMLLKYLREKGVEEDTPFKGLFPLQLDLGYRSHLLKSRGEHRAKIWLDWEEDR